MTAQVTFRFGRAQGYTFDARTSVAKVPITYRNPRMGTGTVILTVTPLEPIPDDELGGMASFTLTPSVEFDPPDAVEMSRLAEPGEDSLALTGPFGMIELPMEFPGVETFQLRITRNGSHADDTISVPLLLVRVTIFAPDADDDHAPEPFDIDTPTADSASEAVIDVPTQADEPPADVDPDAPAPLPSLGDAVVSSEPS